ncbi:MAG: ECF transporter S component [Lachnospiraceae bacterium]|nr:ECF transporter S component [Lachnospiraceae bacterium]
MNMNSKTDTVDKKKLFTTQKMVLIALFGAISAILMVLEFPLPLFPPFLKMDFSELPVIIGGYIMGPFAGLVIILIKVGLNFVFNGTTTGGVGELSNMLCSVCYMIPAVLIYQRKKNKTNAAISLAVGTIVVSIFSIFNNLYLIFPIYSKVMGLDMNAIVGMCSKVNPAIKDTFTLIAIGIVPFNLIKYAVASLITFLVYKRVKKVLFKI